MTRFGRKAQTLSTNIQCAFGRMKIRIIEGKKMINQKNATSYNDEFGEKCRKALEKSYGTAVPIPKCIVK
jgi:hypothetical protein